MKKLIFSLSVLACLFMMLYSCDFKKLSQNEVTATYVQLDTDTDSILVYDSIGQMPEFPGGEIAMNDFVSQNIKYPENAMKAGIEGRVGVKFIIDKDGKVLNPEVINSVNEELDAEALRVVKMLPNFNPGIHEGDTVAVYYTMPFVFKLAQ